MINMSRIFILVGGEMQGPQILVGRGRGRATGSSEIATTAARLSPVNLPFICHLGWVR